MSISVKNITVAIDGTVSKGFTIELDGSKWRMDNFVLQQELMSPCCLSFTLHKGPEEVINEVLFSLCGEIIGKEVKLSLQTDNTESTSEIKRGGDDVVGDIIFKGYIANASGNRDRSEYIVKVEAYTGDIFLIDGPNCRSYEDEPLDQMIYESTESYWDTVVGFSIDQRYKDTVPYCVQYNENTYQFLRRLAMRFGEWLYNDGEKVVFGILPEGETIKLKYPSQDIPSYNVELRMKYAAQVHQKSSYNANKYSLMDCIGDFSDGFNNLHDKVRQASLEKSISPHLQHLQSGGWHDIDSREDIFNISSPTYVQGSKAQMLTYSGKTFCSKVKIGNKLAITDDYISSSQSSSKSNVDQEEILITKVTHYFSADETYSNQFEGIPANSEFPPYANTDVFPVAQSCRAKVKDNKDPLNLGRIRVQFDWQEVYSDEVKEMMTPWLRIVQPYSGGGKGFSFIPEIDEEVMVDFEGGNAERPYVKGALFNGVDSPDEKWLPTEELDNHVKAIRTRNGHTIEIHDKKKGGYIKIYDHKKHNYVVTLSTDQQLIKLESSGDIELIAKNDINMTAGHDIKLKCDNEYNVKADAEIFMHSGRLGTVIKTDQSTNILAKEDISIQSDTKGKGGISVISSSGITTVCNDRTEITRGFADYKHENFRFRADNEGNIGATNDFYITAGSILSQSQDETFFSAKNSLDLKGTNVSISGTSIKID